MPIASTSTRERLKCCGKTCSNHQRADDTSPASAAFTMIAIRFSTPRAIASSNDAANSLCALRYEHNDWKAIPAALAAKVKGTPRSTQSRMRCTVAGVNLEGRPILRRFGFADFGNVICSLTFFCVWSPDAGVVIGFFKIKASLTDRAACASQWFAVGFKDGHVPAPTNAVGASLSFRRVGHRVNGRGVHFDASIVLTGGNTLAIFASVACPRSRVALTCAARRPSGVAVPLLMARRPRWIASAVSCSSDLCGFIFCMWFGSQWCRQLNWPRHRPMNSDASAGAVEKPRDTSR